jgi:hypothetical protein
MYLPGAAMATFNTCLKALGMLPQPLRTNGASNWRNWGREPKDNALNSAGQPMGATITQSERLAIEDADDLDGFQLEFEELLSVEWSYGYIPDEIRGHVDQWAATISTTRLHLDVSSCSLVPTRLDGHLANNGTWPEPVEYDTVAYRADLLKVERLDGNMVAEFVVTQP